ncbi:MAG: 50S ribosomal protein L10 [Pseudomonadota bacterium]|nr:50S ribosomal protein L10 [Pseudomonadota bacterium]
MELAKEPSWKKSKKLLTEREKKVMSLGDITTEFGKSVGTFVVDFKGLNVDSITRLRRNLLKGESDMMVVKNTIAKRALSEGDKAAPALLDLFVGTNALVFAYGDASATAKALYDFRKDNVKLVVKAGFMEGRKLEAAQVEALSKLPPKDVLRAHLLGTMAAPMSQFVRQLAAVPTSFVRVLGANKEKQEKGS